MSPTTMRFVSLAGSVSRMSRAPKTKAGPCRASTRVDIGGDEEDEEEEEGRGIESGMIAGSEKEDILDVRELDEDEQRKLSGLRHINSVTGTKSLWHIKIEKHLSSLPDSFPFWVIS